MNPILREYLQGAVGWVTVATTFVGAMTALLRAILPLLKVLKKWPTRKKAQPSDPTNVPAATSAQTPRVRKKPLILGVILLFVSAFALDFVRKPPMISISEERTNAAWESFKSGELNPILSRPAVPENLNRAIDIANSVVADLAGPAKAKEESLRSAGVPLPPTGEVSSQLRREIFSYGPLNDVATCLWIKGRAAQYLNRTNDAIVAYSELTNFPHARTWDVRGWFWSPSEDGLGRLSVLTNNAPKQP